MFAQRMARFDRWRSLRLASCALALVGVAACTPRLDASFDGEALGAPPTAPLPTPPSDTLVWRTGFATPEVVANPAGGKWVRVIPSQAHLASPDDRRVFLIANSEPIGVAGAPLRGGLRVRLDGPGTLGIGVRPASRADYLGAVEVSNFLPPAGGSVHAMRAFTGEMLNGFQSLPGNAQLAGYAAGDVIEIHWEINQSTHTFSANVLGAGPTVSGVFPTTSLNLPTTPIAAVQMVLWLQRPTSGTTVFIDDTFVNEWR
jgi:hypothetical protein